MSLITERLMIRKFKEEDWPSVYAYASDAETMHYMPEGVLTEQETKDFIRKNRGEKAQNFAVALKKEKTVIGHIVFHPYFGEHTYEIGWAFNAHYQNKGYAFEAASAVLAYGFEKLNLHRIIATCQPENVSSYRLMEKIGMRREGHFKKCIPQGNQWWDEYFYAILEEEWKT